MLGVRGANSFPLRSSRSLCKQVLRGLRCAGRSSASGEAVAGDALEQRGYDLESALRSISEVGSRASGAGEPPALALQGSGGRTVTLVCCCFPGQA